MRNSHLTLRLPADLARALARFARGRGASKSQVAREAVARYLAPSSGPLERAAGAGLTARALAERWAELPRLTPEEAGDLEADIAAARAGLPVVRTPWA
jgi:predicted transcriptional regulator